MMNESEQGQRECEAGSRGNVFKEKEKLYENSGEEELLVLLKELKEVPRNQNTVSHSEELVSRNEEELIQDSLNNDSLNNIRNFGFNTWFY